MEFDFFWIALGIAAAGFFIGNGLENLYNTYPAEGTRISDFRSTNRNCYAQTKIAKHNWNSRRATGFSRAYIKIPTHT